MAVQQKEPDRRALEGDWKVVDARVDGGGAEPLKGRVWTFKDGKLRVVTAGDPNNRANEYAMNFEFEVDSSKTPKQMTLTLVDEAGQMVTNHAIYELDGDRLKVCWTFSPLPGVKTPFPKEFKVVPGDKLTSVLTFARVP